MSSPLGLASNGESFRKNTAKNRFNKVDKKWDKSQNNTSYEESLYNDGSSLAYFPESTNPNSGNNLENDISKTSTKPHGNDIYDVRTQSIIDWSARQSESMKLGARDFAYLRKLGVYPNNRLIVCRKFGSGAPNDLSRIKGVRPVATILSWRPPGEDFLKIGFGEKWVPAEASFTSILNDIGGEFKMGQDMTGSGLGDKIAGGLGAVPLPGFTEIFQRKIMFELGLIDDKGRDIIPAGNPNLIKEAQQRETIADGKAGSGLTYEVSIVVKAEYEQKFIGGRDPSKAFYDILSNIGHFGTQDAVFYLNGASSAKFNKFINGLKTDPRGTIEKLLTDVINGLKAVVSKLVDAIVGDKKDGDEKEKDKNKENADEKSALNKMMNSIIDNVLSIIKGIVRKYEVRIMGVANALTGDASGPWHVTLGNPKRPMFTSGDMICKKVDITLGETLAFNDLPSRITVDFTLTNARPLGLSEIMSRFMQGQGRSYVAGPSSWHESSTARDYNPNNTPDSPTSATASNSAPVGGNQPTTSQSDGSGNIGATTSNQSFASGSGRESTATRSPDPETVRNPTSVTETPTAPVNDVKSDPNTPSTPNSKLKMDRSLNQSEISNATNEQLNERKNVLNDQLANTPPTITDNQGRVWENPDYDKLQEEKFSINSEQEDRTENQQIGASNINKK